MGLEGITNALGSAKDTVLNNAGKAKDNLGSAAGGARDTVGNAFGGAVVPGVDCYEYTGGIARVITPEEAAANAKPKGTVRQVVEAWRPRWGRENNVECARGEL